MAVNRVDLPVYSNGRVTWFWLSFVTWFADCAAVLQSGKLLLRSTGHGTVWLVPVILGQIPGILGQNLGIWLDSFWKVRPARFREPWELPIQPIQASTVGWPSCSRSLPFPPARENSWRLMVRWSMRGALCVEQTFTPSHVGTCSAKLKHCYLRQNSTIQDACVVSRVIAMLWTDRVRWVVRALLAHPSLIVS